MGLQTYDIRYYQALLFCAEGFNETEDVVGAFFAEVTTWWSG
jgi:phenylalanine-4-hydroxylase